MDEPRKAVPHEAAVHDPRQTFSITVIALLCSAILIGYVALAAIAESSAGIQLPSWLTVFILFGAIHICAWFSMRRSSRILFRRDLFRLFVGCAIAFCFVDEGLILALQWANYLATPESYATTKAVVATIVDILIVFAIVFVTVPLGTRLYGPKRVA